MPAGEHKSQVSETQLLADASNRMHALSDIASIMRIAVTTGMQLVAAAEAAAALCLEGRLCFSEYRDASGWQQASWSCGAEHGRLGVMLSQHETLVFPAAHATEAGLACEDEDFVSAGPLIAVPVSGRANKLLACLLFYHKQGGPYFDVRDSQLLEQLASMVAVAVENSIQITESRRVEADLQKSVATYRTLVEQIPAITYIATLDRSRILFVSPQIEDILGFSQDDFLADQEIWSQQIHPDDRERVLADVRQSLNENIPFHCEYRIRAKNGKDIWVKDAASKVRDHDQDLYFQGVVHDISDRKATEQQLLQMAHYDQLTGLANRALFHDRLEQVVAHSKRQQQRFALLYLDLDGFKLVNDELGHQAGDVLLAETASRLMAHVREVDTVARMGGDEFTIILDNMHSGQEIAMVAAKLVAAVSGPYEHLGADHGVTVSMGIAIYPDDSSDAGLLMTAADHAMYRAKSSGKDCFCFYQQEQTKSQA